MPEFRARKTITAVQFTGDRTAEEGYFGPEVMEANPWLTASYAKGAIKNFGKLEDDGTTTRWLQITLPGYPGPIVVTKSSWIIDLEGGRVVTMSDNQFHDNYEPI